MGKQVNFSIIKEALNDYVENGLSIKKCALRHKIGATTLARYLEKLDISKNEIDTRTYTYDKDFFKNIDSEEKAYWLGFIAADGSIINNGYGLEISVAYSDKEHLEKFIASISGELSMITYLNKTAGNGKYYPTARVRVMSKQLCDDLYGKEIVPNKGLMLDFPCYLSESLIRHYLRGYFDGDGSISTNGRNRNGSPKYALNLIATESFLINFMNHLKNLGVSEVKLQSKCNMFVWNKVGINQIGIILNYLYDNCNIYLERKHIKYLDICSPELNSH